MKRGGIWVTIIIGILGLATLSVVAPALIQQINVSQTNVSDNLSQTALIFTIPIIFLALLSSIVLGVAKT